MSPERALQLSSTVRALSIAVTIAAISGPAIGSEGIGPVPKPSCGPHDRQESVQGQTTLAERLDAGPTQAYTCNLELVGQFEGEGTDGDLEVFEDCAYYSTAGNPKRRNPGVPVLDVSDHRHPKATTYLASPAMLQAHKSLEISQARKLLLATPQGGARVLETYDISNCRHPVLRSSANLPDGMKLHTGQWSADGLMFYGANFDPRNPLIFALDLSDPSKLRSIAMWGPPKDKQGWVTHGVVINKDATRAYVSLKRMPNWPESVNPNGLLIFDISDVHARRAGAAFRLVSSLFWDDTYGAGGMVTVKIKGRPYLIFSDSFGATGIKKPVPAEACDAGKPGHGFARVIDISDEQHPTLVSKLMPEVSQPINCSKSMHDPTTYGSYGSSACSVDSDEEGRLLACGNFEGGLRVFDIRDPAQPREVAYYKPPARRMQERPGSVFRFLPGSAADLTADSVFAAPRFRDSGQEIWFTSVDNGFQVVHFSDRFKAAQPDLFQR